MNEEVIKQLTEALGSVSKSLNSMHERLEALEKGSKPKGFDAISEEDRKYFEAAQGR